MTGSDVCSSDLLASLPDDTIVCPGHKYHPMSAGSLEAVRASNWVFRPKTKEQWMSIFPGRD